MFKIKALILCAGYATRLYPLTLDQPKPLLKVSGKPIIEHILKKIEKIDEVDEILIVTNHKFYLNFQDWLSSYSSNKRIKIIDDKTTSNEDRLGAIGDINFAIKNENINDNLLVIAGDNLFEFDLKKLFNFFKQKDACINIVYDIKEKEKASKKFGVVKIDKDNRIIGFEEKPEKPKTSMVSTACYIFTKKDLEWLKKCVAENKKPDNLGDFIKRLIEKGHVYGFVFSERWFDIGSYDQLKEVDKIWKSKNV